MLLSVLRTLFQRDLQKLRKEIESYQQEENIWRVAPGISNSAGNLCLHLVGNLNAYIGMELGHSGYIRNRDLEFSARDIAKEELLQKIDATAAIVDITLQRLSDPQLEQEYPALVFAEKTTSGHFLVHLTTHLAYHLGQINYHRRLLDPGN